MVLGIDERIDGVNLGNWLVLEKWMDPKPFTLSAEDDEIWMHRTHVSLWSERNLAEELRRHRETYITLEDFRIIVGHGINLVRIPIPYFIFGDWPGHPGCITYLDRAFRWARETGLKIMIDLHTVPESQNGFDNGGLTGAEYGLGGVHAERAGAIGSPIPRRTGPAQHRSTQRTSELVGVP